MIFFFVTQGSRLDSRVKQPRVLLSDTVALDSTPYVLFRTLKECCAISHPAIVFFFFNFNMLFCLPYSRLIVSRVLSPLKQKKLLMRQDGKCA